ncbi:low temperature requirement protein A [Motilibacter aurantiacus]|uniref:low temperature requirement protein A n=1 Tax=Motilibacter aurantiacus TaxID=2714955 RepID=UPI00140774BD|nr:low temperature requirement protein A [Motilibacter aurantiacus]
MPLASATPVGRFLERRGLLRPPALQTRSTRTASRLELFFDLAFVLVVAELAISVREDIDVGSVLRFGGLFAVVWWSWMSSTLYANRFDHDDLIFRLNKLGSMLAVVGLAGSASDATGTYATEFTLSYVALRVLLLLQYLRAYRHVPEARAGILTYVVGTGAGALLWTASLAVEGNAKLVLWGVGLAVDAAAPLLVTTARVQVPLHLEHLPERFSLFVILVLGEPVAAVAHGVHDASWEADAVLAGAIAFVLAAALWWSYFDLAGAAAKHLLDEAGDEHSTVAHDVYIYGQLPLALSIAAVGAGLEGLVVEGAADASAGSRALVSGGVALYLLSVALTNVGMQRRGRSGWWWAALAALVAAADALLDLPALAVAGVLAALLVVVVAFGLEQHARGNLQLEEM